MEIAQAERWKLLTDILKGAFGSVGLAIYILADTFFVAQYYGEIGVAATNIVLPLFNVIEGLGIMFGMGAATWYTIRKNATGHPDQRIFAGIVRVGLVVGLVFSALGVFATPQVAHLMGATTPALYRMAVPYLQIILIASPLFILSNLIIAFVRNDNDMLLSTYALLGSAVYNILADWLFIWVFQWGMHGAAFATASAPLVSLIIQLAHWLPWRHKSQLQWRGKIASLQTVATSMRLGAPSFLMELSNGVTIFIFNWVVLLFCGEQVLVAYGIATNILLVMLALYTGTAQGSQPFISANYGRSRLRAIWLGLKFAVSCTLVLALAGYVFVTLHPQLTIAFFTENSSATLVHLTQTGLPLIMLSLFFSAINTQICIFLAAIDQAATALLLVVIRGYLLVFPIVFTLTALAKTPGMWLSMPVIELVALVCGGVALARAKHQLIEEMSE